MIEGWMMSNLVIAALGAVGVAVGIWIAKNRLWKEACGQLWRRRPFALVVIALYIAVAAADSIYWVGTDSESTDVVARHQALSLVDRLFLGTEEASYSAPFSEVEFYGGAALAHPATHPLGTDILGRDVLYLALKGARVALLIGGITSLIAMFLGLLFGVAAGYFGGRIDDAVFFLISTLSSIPGLLLLITLIMVMGRSTLSVCVALGITSWVGFCRITRGETFKLRELEYVQAARALGASDIKIVLRHVLPNLIHLVVITFVLMFSGLVLSEAILSWLGIGVDGSWGQMIDQARDELSREPVVWWNIATAGGALFILLLAVNFVGDAVRDVLDPRTLREDL